MCKGFGYCDYEIGVNILILDLTSINTLICRGQCVFKMGYVLRWLLFSDYLLDVDKALTKSHTKGEFPVNLYVNGLAMTSVHLLILLFTSLCIFTV